MATKEGNPDQRDAHMRALRAGMRGSQLLIETLIEMTEMAWHRGPFPGIEDEIQGYEIQT